MADGGEAVRLPNPFDGAQREGRDPTVKWVLWEVLARHYRDGARVAELEKDERLLALRPKMRAAKNLNGQITGELGSDKGAHFIRDFKGQPGVWGVRLHAAAAAGEQPRGGSVGSAAASAQQQGADAAAPSPHDAQQQRRQQQQQDAQHQHQHPGAQPQPAARGPKAAAIPSPPVPGNESEAAPWVGATCQFLTDRLWKRGAAVWWPAEQQYFNGKIVETLSEEGGDLLLLHVLYDDQTDEWMRPTRFRVSGGKEHSVVVITENEVYIRDEASGRLVPDPNQGVDPAALGAGQAAGGGDAAAQQQQALQQPQSVRSAASRSSGGHGGRRPHAARAPADIPTKGSWWQKAVVDDEARALELQKQRTTSSDEPHPQSPVAADGRAQQAQQEGQTQRVQQEGQQQQRQQEQQQLGASSRQVEQQPAVQQARRPEGQQQERKRKMPTEEAGAERAQAQHDKLPAQQAQKGRQQRPREQQQHAEKRQRRESSAADEHPQQHRRQSQGGERPAKPPIPPSSGPVAPKFFSIPKRPQAEQPAPKHGVVGAAEGSKAKGGSTPFRIPKAATALPAAAPTAAGAASAERQGGKRPRESVEGAPDEWRPSQPQGRVEAERGQRGQHVPPPPPPQQQHSQQQQHGHERMQQQQAAAPSPHDQHHAQQQQQQQQHAPPQRQPPQQHSHERQQQHPRERHEQQQPQQERQRQEHGRERDQQRQPRARSPEAVRKEERATRDLILRHCKADVHQRMGAVRWSVRAVSAELPTPRLEPGSAAAVVAVLAPHKAALSERLSAGGPWPHGAALLPAPGAAAAGLAGATAAAPAQPTEDAQFGRIFVCKRNTTSACFKRNVFVSNSDIDLQGLQPGSLALLHSLDEKLVYGWFKVVECGTNLDPGFPADAAFKYHVRVQPLHLFQPVPDTLLDTFVERKVHPKTGQRMKFFDRHLDGRQCRQIWSLMHHYNEKLHDSRDTLWRLSPLTPAGAGFWKALAQQEARAAGGGGGGGGGGGELQDAA